VSNIKISGYASGCLVLGSSKFLSLCASKNDVQFKGGQNRLKNNYFASLAKIHDPWHTLHFFQVNHLGQYPGGPYFPHSSFLPAGPYPVPTVPIESSGICEGILVSLALLVTILPTFFTMTAPKTLTVCPISYLICCVAK